MPQVRLSAQQLRLRNPRRTLVQGCGRGWGADMPGTSISPVVPAVLPGEGRPARPGLVRRDRLIAQLAGASDAPCCCWSRPRATASRRSSLTGPSEDERPSAWLTLDERHNDPALLLGAIASVLDAIEPIGDEVFAPLATPGAECRASSSLASAKRSRLAASGLRARPRRSPPRGQPGLPGSARRDRSVDSRRLSDRVRQPNRAALPLGRMRAHRLLAEFDATISR